LRWSITLAIAVFFVCIDILAPRQKVLVFSGTFLGLLVGMLISYGLSYVIFLIIDLFFPGHGAGAEGQGHQFTTSDRGNSVLLSVASALCFRPRMIFGLSCPMWSLPSRCAGRGR
jgi:hypothetical protein